MHFGVGDTFVATINDRLNIIYYRNPVIFSVMICTLVCIVELFISFTVFAQARGNEYSIEGDLQADRVSSASNLENAESTLIKVDLSGAVKSPGVYEVAKDSRVWDLIALGNGVSEDICPSYLTRKLNMAQKLSDGTKVFIPFSWDVGYCSSYSSDNTLSELDLSSDTYVEVNTDTNTLAGMGDVSSAMSDLPSTSTLINVNTASLGELDTLPGIGTVYAGKIVQKRPYTSLSDFEERSLLPRSLVLSISSLIKF